MSYLCCPKCGDIGGVCGNCGEDVILKGEEDKEELLKVLRSDDLQAILHCADYWWKDHIPGQETIGFEEVLRRFREALAKATKTP